MGHAVYSPGPGQRQVTAETGQLHRTSHPYSTPSYSYYGSLNLSLRAHSTHKILLPETNKQTFFLFGA